MTHERNLELITSSLPAEVFFFVVVEKKNCLMKKDCCW
jgi:hypothetical protein